MLSPNRFDWTPSIGDPTLMAWIVVAAYLITALLAIRVYMLADTLFPQSILRKQKLFWSLIVLIMLFLGINKQLDLQSLLTSIGRYYAKKEGWYHERRKFQTAFIAIIILLGSFFISIIIRYMKDTLKENGLAILGFGFLLMFIIIRASSFHHVDFLLKAHFTHFIGMLIHWIMEMTGILLIAYSAFSLINQYKPEEKSSDGYLG